MFFAETQNELRFSLSAVERTSIRGGFFLKSSGTYGQSPFYFEGLFKVNFLQVVQSIQDLPLDPGNNIIYFNAGALV